MTQENQEIPLLTFNSLYNLLREEKKTKVLQKLPEQFYQALNKFFEDKKKELERLKSSKELEKLKKEKNILKNSNKITEELISLRATKIANIAIKNQIYNDDELLSKESILEYENEFFELIQKATNTLKKTKNFK